MANRAGLYNRFEDQPLTEKILILDNPRVTYAYELRK